MPNITLAIDKELLKLGREYAQKHQMSLNALIRQLLEAKISGNQQSRIEACFELMDVVKASSEGKKFSREELYDR